MSEAAELSSLATVLADLSGRVTVTAERMQDDKREDVATALFEVERALKGAARRLDQARSLLS